MPVEPAHATSFSFSDESELEATHAAPGPTEPSNTPRKRSTQAVSTLNDRRKVPRWMFEREGIDGMKRLFSGAVDTFTSVFNSSTRNANLSKAVNWWKRREKIMNAPRDSATVSRRSSEGPTRVAMKVIGGRGRPRSKWVLWLYPRVLKEFDRP